MTADTSPSVRDEAVWDRSTAPQSPYTGREVAIGFVVFLVGAAVAFGLPIAMA